MLGRMLSTIIMNAFRNGEGLTDVHAGGAPGAGAVRHSAALTCGGGNEAGDAGVPTAAGAGSECECRGEQWHDAVDDGRAWTKVGRTAFQGTGGEDAGGLQVFRKVFSDDSRSV